MLVLNVGQGAGHYGLDTWGTHVKCHGFLICRKKWKDLGAQACTVGWPNEPLTTLSIGWAWGWGAGMLLPAWGLWCTSVEGQKMWFVFVSENILNLESWHPGCSPSMFSLCHCSSTALFASLDSSAWMLKFEAHHSSATQPFSFISVF